MTKDEALPMAIEALEMHVPHYVKDRGCEAINACEEALEQPKEKKYLYVYHENGHPLTIIPYRFANHTGYEYLGKIEVSK